MLSAILYYVENLLAQTVMTKVYRHRKSPLALWRASFVKQQLGLHHPGLPSHWVPMVHKVTKILDTPLAKIGGKGFVLSKELEQAMLEKPR